MYEILFFFSKFTLVIVCTEYQTYLPATTIIDERFNYYSNHIITYNKYLYCIN